MNFQDIYKTYEKTYEKFIEYAVSKTDLAIKNSDFQNIKESGGMTEEIIKNFFNKTIP